VSQALFFTSDGRLKNPFQQQITTTQNSDSLHWLLTELIAWCDWLFSHLVLRKLFFYYFT